MWFCHLGAFVWILEIFQVMQRQFLRTGITLGSFKLDVATVMSQQGKIDWFCLPKNFFDPDHLYGFAFNVHCCRRCRDMSSSSNINTNLQLFIFSFWSTSNYMWKKDKWLWHLYGFAYMPYSIRCPPTQTPLNWNMQADIPFSTIYYSWQYLEIFKCPSKLCLDNIFKYPNIQAN